MSYYSFRRIFCRVVFDLESYDSLEGGNFLTAVTLDLPDEDGSMAVTPGLVYHITAQGYPLYDDFDILSPAGPDFPNAEFIYTFQNSRPMEPEYLTEFEVCRLYR